MTETDSYNTMSKTFSVYVVMLYFTYPACQLNLYCSAVLSAEFCSFRKNSANPRISRKICSASQIFKKLAEGSGSSWGPFPQSCPLRVRKLWSRLEKYASLSAGTFFSSNILLIWVPGHNIVPGNVTM